MEFWSLILISVAISTLIRPLFNLLFISKKPTELESHPQIPPGPPAFPIIGNLFWLRRSLSELESVLRPLHAKLGPAVTLRIGSRTAIFVADRSLAHQALVQNGAVFSNRPPALAVSKIITSNQHNISSAFYGPTWRTLRRNLTSEILHPSRVKSYGLARKWVLDILKDRLRSKPDGEPVKVMGHLQFAMFCLLVLMCFGDKLDEEQIKKVEHVERQLLVNSSRFNVLSFWPLFSKIFFRKRWAQFFQYRKEQADVLVPMIRARKVVVEERLAKAGNDGGSQEKDQEHVVSYVDTLLGLQLPEEKRNLTEDEIVNLCNEFLNAGTDTTSTALQWILANLVKYPEIQDKLFLEIKGVMGDKDVEEEVKEEDLQRMPYLKAVVLEGLRRHPPGHFVLPHAVTEDAVLGKYLVPKKGTINFMVAEMGWDPKVWEDPMAFKPERFLINNNNNNGGEAFDITGSREIKMMPFGAGRRICPGYALALLHLEYFVANLIWNFEWKARDGDEVDLSEKPEFTMVMKYPLQAYISPRMRI
ncbi:hypothetical protein Tsubulata_029833 [Turnera subulata]|uniref:Cytochrome P450 n=1 Tax=Turnera subulata TaxID=218843 RepID=A0A9Q0FQ18_9ROSI|nr:hypothetical protein Tsubulata_029833 [Turnera subulata]